MVAQLEAILRGVGMQEREALFFSP